MNFSIENILISFVFSGIGFVYFSYGRKMGLPAFALTGLALMVYPYAVDSLVTLMVVDIGLSLAPFIARRLGW